MFILIRSFQYYFRSSIFPHTQSLSSWNWLPVDSQPQFCSAKCQISTVHTFISITLPFSHSTSHSHAHCIQSGTFLLYSPSFLFDDQRRKDPNFSNLTEEISSSVSNSFHPPKNTSTVRKFLSDDSVKNTQPIGSIQSNARVRIILKLPLYQGLNSWPWLQTQWWKFWNITKEDELTHDLWLLS